MWTVKIILASFDFPIHSYDDDSEISNVVGLPYGMSIPEGIKAEANKIQSIYDSYFDTTGPYAKFLGFLTNEDKDVLLNMSYSLASSLKAILPKDIKIENTVGQTLLLAPMRKDVEEMDRKASEDLEKEDDDGQEGPDCE